MNLVVDTSVWSLVLRRQTVNEADAYVRTLRHCVHAKDGVFLIGPILQELLDGLRSPEQFARLLTMLEPFPFVPLLRSTYALAAQMRNECRREGINAGPTDFLVAAACVESGYPLLAADQDFARIADSTGLVLLPLDGGAECKGTRE